jgi:acyl dehydratase
MPLCRNNPAAQGWGFEGSGTAERITGHSKQWRGISDSGDCEKQSPSEREGREPAPDGVTRYSRVMALPTDVWPNGQPAVGDTAERSRVITARDIELFTAISGDRNPLHYDAEAAAATSFGGIVVQGGIITAILNAVVAEDLPGPGTVFLHVDWNFRAPVRPGDVITGRVEVIEVRSDKPIARLLTTVSRDDGVVAVEGRALCYTMALPAGR